MHPSEAAQVDLATDFDDESDYAITVKKGPVKCVCPRCSITHVLNFFWSGKGTPRKYCHRCRETIVNVDSEYVYESVYEGIRRQRNTMSSVVE